LKLDRVALRPKIAKEEDIVLLSQHSVRTLVDRFQNELALPCFEVPILLSSDTEDDICRCNEVVDHFLEKDHCELDAGAVRSMSNKKAVWDSQSLQHQCSRVLEDNIDKIQAQNANTDNNLAVKVKPISVSYSHSNGRRSSTTTKVESAVVKYKVIKVAEVSETDNPFSFGHYSTTVKLPSLYSVAVMILEITIS